MTDKRGFARNDRGRFEIATAACGSLAMTEKGLRPAEFILSAGEGRGSE